MQIFLNLSLNEKLLAKDLLAQTETFQAINALNCNIRFFRRKLQKLKTIEFNKET